MCGASTLKKFYHMSENIVHIIFSQKCKSWKYFCQKMYSSASAGQNLEIQCSCIQTANKGRGLRRF